jgi:pilus assembly protein CpaF
VSADLIDRVRQRLAGSDAAGAGVPHLGQVAGQESSLLLDSGARSELTGQLAAELTGAGPLEQLLAEAGVTDVLVNAADQVWLDRGAGLERAGVRFESDAAVRRLAARLAAQAGRRLDDAAPFVDAVLPDGTRLHAILPPLVAHPTVSLRVLARRRLSILDLVELGSVPAAVAELLAAVVQARLTLLISGGTGSGKTTLLAALLATVGPLERIITIEDAAELAVCHPHVVALLARSANIEHAGGVQLGELVRQALRMRADRLVVGEFRGGEIVELLAALNTGHSGGAATVHANSVTDVPARLVALAALGGMSASALVAQAASALDVLVHIRRDRSGLRRIEQLALWPAESMTVHPALVWTRTAGLGAAAGRLRSLIEAAGIEVPQILAGPNTCQP